MNNDKVALSRRTNHRQAPVAEIRDSQPPHAPIDFKSGPYFKVTNIQRRFNFKSFILTGEFLPYLVLSAIGIAIVAVVGSIAFNAIRNHGLIPPPNTLDQYACSSANGPFAFYYLHGTERVKIKSTQGILEGTVHQNQFDWASFARDTTQLGFLPPTEIFFEDSASLRFRGPGADETVCEILAKHVGERRAIVR